MSDASDESAFDDLVEEFDAPITVILTQRSDDWLPEIDVAGTDSGDEAILALAKGLFMLLNDAVNGPYVDEDEDGEDDEVDEDG